MALEKYSAGISDLKYINLAKFFNNNTLKFFGCYPSTLSKSNYMHNERCYDSQFLNTWKILKNAEKVVKKCEKI